MVESRHCFAKNTSRKIWAALLAAMLALSTLTLAGCSGSDASSSASASSSSASAQASSSAASSSSASASASDADVQVTVNIVFPDDADKENVSEAVGMPEGSTVLDALEEVDSSIVVSDSQYGPFVEEIGGVANGSRGASSGWTYTVNGEYATDSAGDHKLAEGDVVEWTFYM